MANITSAKKRVRQNIVRRCRNTSYRAMVRTFLRKVDAAIINQDKEAATNAYKMLVPIIDRASNKGLIHKNKAIRHKSKLNARLRALSL